MAKVGYARASSTGQSLDVQIAKLEKEHCDRIYQEKRSGRTADRPEFKACMDYLREGDTLVISRLDRLARSVVHLAQLGNRFQKEGIGLKVIDQNIDTSTPTGRLMFNMLASIAEFENDLRAERQSEGIAKAKENGVKFGRPPKLTRPKIEDIYFRREAGESIGELASAFNLGNASIYRALKSAKELGLSPRKKTTKIKMWLEIENNSKFVRGKSKSRKDIELFLLPRFNAVKLTKGGSDYELTFEYESDEDLERQIEELADEICREASMRNGWAECGFSEIGTDRCWL